jgi:hypothetical protein
VLRDGVEEVETTDEEVEKGRVELGVEGIDDTELMGDEEDEDEDEEEEEEEEEEEDVCDGVDKPIFDRD